ncbi:OLC1v1037171C1 [Oldenlandia corymbosa var. corymbosa]|uniref:OLC1v1037171C1 n=1 Tax=Oldenlandia corymbosa var. corymbosa TaxID=529605 RepID=A0AAV1CYG0_OLDCO|nr:OLC1v1037171C1 [Oldenlandia corymbosa var. corymbosa]
METKYRHQHLPRHLQRILFFFFFFFFFLSIAQFFHIVRGDVGTAARYSPPYSRKENITWYSLYSFTNMTITLGTDEIVNNIFHDTLIHSATTCYGRNPSQFPASNLFAAAGDGIWDNGASCGRQYLVKCISASSPDICVTGQVIQVIIVDYAPQLPSQPSATGKTMVLSDSAFGAITNSDIDSISIEFLQV